MSITPRDVLKHLALAAGYRVHVWDAVENGDAADSYFWKASGAISPIAQSRETFASAELAWLDCCESTNLLLPILEDVESAGCRLIREPGFIAYQWVDTDGEASAERFGSPAEALVACAMALVGEDAPPNRPQISPV